MHRLKPLLILLVVFTTTTSVAQKENAQKILGCWVFKKIEYTTTEEIPTEGLPQPNSVTVCFEDNGKYTTTMVNSTAIINGKYQVSKDGKTITQQRELKAEDTVDEDATIEFPNDNIVILKIAFAHLHFERKQ